MLLWAGQRTRWRIGDGGVRLYRGDLLGWCRGQPEGPASLSWRHEHYDNRVPVDRAAVLTDKCWPFWQQTGR